MNQFSHSPTEHKTIYKNALDGLQKQESEPLFSMNFAHLTGLPDRYVRKLASWKRLTQSFKENSEETPRTKKSQNI